MSGRRGVWQTQTNSDGVWQTPSARCRVWQTALWQTRRLADSDQFRRPSGCQTPSARCRVWQTQTNSDGIWLLPDAVWQTGSAKRGIWQTQTNSDGPLPDGAWQTRRLVDSDQFRRRLADGPLPDAVWQTRRLADSDQFRWCLAARCRLAALTASGRRGLPSDRHLQTASGCQTALCQTRHLARLRPIQTASGRRHLADAVCQMPRLADGPLTDGVWQTWRLADSDHVWQTALCQTPRQPDGVCRLADAVRRRLADRVWLPDLPDAV